MNAKKISNIFYIGDWQVTPQTNCVRAGDTVTQLEPKAMDVLLLLCQQRRDNGHEHALSADDIASQCWGSEIGDNPVHKAITQLRKAFSDKPSTPKYIETIRKRGYRIVAKLDFPDQALTNATQQSTNDWQGGSPFPGLSAFEPDESEVFFGRSAQITTLLTRVSKLVDAKHAFCLVLGPSGSGKSSLINAGVLPRLTHQNGHDGIGVVSYTSVDFADVSQSRLFIDLASSMLDWDVNDTPVFDGLSAETLADMLQKDSSQVAALCNKALASIQQQTPASRYAKPQLFLFIDRLEVLLSSPVFNDDERKHFLKCLDTLATSGSILIFSACRNDFYPLVVAYPSLMAGKDQGSHFDLLPPSSSELSQMIRLPAKAANLSWTNEPNSTTSLDEILCHEAVDHPDALPMLQYTLQELYEQRSTNNEMQYSVYRKLGGIEGAIGKKAEEIFLQLSKDQQAQLEYILSLLVTLTPDGENITSRAARWSQLDDNPITHSSQHELVQAMVESRLLVSHLQHGEPCFSLAHEALLRKWPRASNWINEHRDALRIKSQLQQLAGRWQFEDRNKAYLLPEGKPLLEAVNLQKSAVFKLDEEECALIKASQKSGNVKRWLKRTTVTLLCVLTFTALFMSVKSQQAENLAQQKRLEAESLLGFMVGEFADKLRSVKRMDLLDGISNKALEYFSQQDEEVAESIFPSLTSTEQNFKTRFQHAQTLAAMGEVAYSRNKNDEAKQAFGTAQTILDKLYKIQPENSELLKALGANAFWLGQLASDKAEFTLAKPHFEEYLSYSKLINQLTPNSDDAKLELSYAYLAIGGINSKLQKLDEARGALEKALAIQYELTEDLPQTNMSHLDIADTLEWLAETEEQLGYLEQAVQTREKVQHIINNLLEPNSGNGNLIESIAYSYLNNANVLYYLGHYTAANQAAVSAKVNLDTLLMQDPSNEVWQVDLFRAHVFELYLMALVHKAPDSQTITWTDFQKIIFRAKKFHALIAIVIKSYQLGGNWDLADSAIQLAKSKLEQLLSERPANQLLLTALSNVYLLAAKQDEHAQNQVGAASTNNVTINTHSEKRQACQQAANLLRPIVTDNSSYEVLLPYVQAHDCLQQQDKVRPFIDKLALMQIKNYSF
ncbi:transcriptional regulatory protein-like protein [Paraglaciecola mesophila KMM 241]|uniref:Transcriptional regulatory protein-like protein n=1 Tax=Paraglaciecola mesophila KMM 241 TaxID=1128912 RepID=K6ZM59_9ALTE|nr:winged helix-turn-helix domain-containing protein [Paraglaciecola mesophila]GAC24445.1 transcriptional regulatory protein-like protein [Paraglaciecola mesophila KMM 241]